MQVGGRCLLTFHTVKSTAIHSQFTGRALWKLRKRLLPQSGFSVFCTTVLELPKRLCFVLVGLLFYFCQKLSLGRLFTFVFCPLWRSYRHLSPFICIHHHHSLTANGQHESLQCRKPLPGIGLNGRGVPNTESTRYSKLRPLSLWGAQFTSSLSGDWGENESSNWISTDWVFQQHGKSQRTSEASGIWPVHHCSRLITHIFLFFVTLVLSHSIIAKLRRN